MAANINKAGIEFQNTPNDLKRLAKVKPIYYRGFISGRLIKRPTRKRF
jgi:hypothetical protein